VCGSADRRVLRRHRLGVLCANHAAVAGRRRLSVAELAAECYPAADRRSGERRRGDRRSHSERRRRVEVEWLLEGDRRRAPRRDTDPPYV